MPHRAYARQYAIYLAIVCSVPWVVFVFMGIGMSNLLFVLGLTLVTVSGLTLGAIVLVELVAWTLKGCWRAIVARFGWLHWPSLPARQ